MNVQFNSQPPDGLLFEIVRPILAILQKGQMLKTKVQKMKTGLICVYLLLTLFFLVADIFAETPSGNLTGADKEEQTLKQKSLDPTANLKQFQIQNRFIPSTFDQEGYANVLTPTSSATYTRSIEQQT